MQFAFGNSRKGKNHGVSMQNNCIALMTCPVNKASRSKNDLAQLMRSLIVFYLTLLQLPQLFLTTRIMHLTAQQKQQKKNSIKFRSYYTYHYYIRVIFFLFNSSIFSIFPKGGIFIGKIYFIFIYLKFSTARMLRNVC